MNAEIRAVDPVDVEKPLAACNDPRYSVVVLLAAEAGLRIRGPHEGSFVNCSHVATNEPEASPKPDNVL